MKTRERGRNTGVERTEAEWLCAALAVLGIPVEYELLFLRGLIAVAIVLVVGVPIVWKQRYLEATARYVETEGLYEGFERAVARDLHKTFLRLCTIQRALNGLTRDYHVKEHDLWVAEQAEQRAAIASIKAQLIELESQMVLQYDTYNWEILSVFRRLEQRGHVPDERLLATLDGGVRTVAAIDEMSAGLHRMIREVGPHAW